MPNIAKIIPSGPDSVFNWAIIDSAADLVLALARISPVLRLTVSRVRVHHPRYSVWWQSQWPPSQHRIPPSFVITAASTHSHAASEQWCWWCMITMMLVRWCTDHSDADDNVITVKMMRYSHNDADEMMHWSQWCWWDDALITTITIKLSGWERECRTKAKRI